MPSRPYIIINVAQSLNGMIAGSMGSRVSISCEEDLKRVDGIRRSVDAILVGANTVINDNPSLTIRGKTGQGPLRIVLDNLLRIPDGSKILDGNVETIIFTSRKDRIIPNARMVVLDEADLQMSNVMEQIYGMGVRRILVEGGRTVINELLTAGLCDEFYVYEGNIIIHDGLPLFQPNKDLRDIVIRKTIIGNGVLYRLDCDKIKGE
ncbi:2,5-diamino-6-ribosylamino-4(3H)-pyrimidinone 5'-phosphate reductase [Thermoplasmatales archaeon]|nr:2,5-diamino-6-ribosylamino-4(3H)-pyrimidinone 5'-phosphate reductase [Thermoplasmatales archaeon]